MLTFAEARKIAKDTIDSYRPIGNRNELVIVDNATIEKPYAWIFHYTSKLYLETGYMGYALGGNAPLFIAKTNGQVSTYRTGLSIAGMIEEYEEEFHIWQLVLLTNIYADIGKLHSLKRTLVLSINDIADYKQNKKMILDKGSEKRLLNLQQLLKKEDIQTEVLERELI